MGMSSYVCTHPFASACWYYIWQLNGQLLGPTEFKERPPDATLDLKALCNVAQILMQGYEGSPPRIDRPQRWGDGALAFFNALTKATEIGLLQQVSAATVCDTEFCAKLNSIRSFKTHHQGSLER